MDLTTDLMEMGKRLHFESLLDLKFDVKSHLIVETGTLVEIE